MTTTDKFVTTDTVNRYLEDNGFPPNKGYVIKARYDDLENPFISTWAVPGLAKPSNNELRAILDTLEVEKI